MIVQSRWMTRSVEGISDEWIDNMLNDKRLAIVHDFEDAGMCFPGVEIKGGVNYFLWSRDVKDKCDYYFHSADGKVFHRLEYLDKYKAGIVIRDMNSFSILDKIMKVEGEYFGDENKNFSGLVSPKDFFTNKEVLTSSWHGYSETKKGNQNVKLYVNKAIHKCDYGWISEKVVPKHTSSISLNKVYIPAAGGTGTDDKVLGNPFLGEENSVCSQTYLVIGYDPDKHNFSKKQCNNIISYVKTRFFRYLVSIKKKTQNGPRNVYQFVPMQDFSKPWTDEELYKKYKLTKEEIEFIESMIKPMDLDGEKNG